MFEDIGVGITVRTKGLKEAYDGFSTLEDKINDVNGKRVDVGMSGTVKGAKTSNGLFAEMISNTKKFAFALLTVRGVWFAIRKSMTMYLSQNEELQARLNGIYYAMGSLFAPVLELLIKILATILWMVNEILISLGFAGLKMKNFGKATGSAAKQMKQLLGFDEINNLTSKQGSGGGSTKIKNPFEDILWAKFLKEHLWEILGLIIAIAAAMKAWSMGVTGLKLLGIAVAVYSAIQLVKAFIDYLNDPSWQNFGNTIKWIGGLILGLGMAFGQPIAIISGAVIFLMGLLAEYWPQISEWISNLLIKLDELKVKVSEELGPVFGFVVNTIITILQDALATIRDIFGSIFTSAKQMLDGVIDIFKGNFVSGIHKILNGLISLIEGFINSVIDGFNRLTEGIRSKASSLLSVIGINLELGAIPHVTLPRYDQGTNFVPNDQIAMVHRGEAIVPKEFNPSAFYGNSTAEELNLLASINEQLVELNAKNIDVTLDGESVATTINNHIQNINERNGQRVFALGR